MVANKEKIIWLMVITLVICFLGVGYFWNKTTMQLKQAASNASALTYNAILSSYEKNGFTDDEAKLLVNYLVRSLVASVCQGCHVNDISISMVTTSSHAFDASDINIVLREGSSIHVDYIDYDGKRTEITFAVSNDMKGPLGSFKRGNIYIISIQNGQWYIRR